MESSVLKKAVFLYEKVSFEWDVSIHAHIVYTAHTFTLLPICLNMGTEEVLVNKWKTT